MEDEINQPKKKYDELLKERDTALQETEVLRQKYVAAIRQWDLTLQELDKIKQISKLVELQYEEANDKLNTTVASNKTKDEEFINLSKSCASAVEEYKTVMEERDNVLNENEKLSDNLSLANKQNEALEKDIKSCRDEIEALKLHIESLKCEMSSILLDRDEALKKYDDYKKTFEEITIENVNERIFMSHLNFGFNRAIQNKNNFLRPVEVPSTDLFDLSQNKPMNNLSKANLEIERLRKLTKKYHAELSKSLCERDQIKLEHKSLQTFCNSLRIHRGEAEVQLVQAIRKCDYLATQRRDYAKELCDLKQKTQYLSEGVHSVNLNAARCYDEKFFIEPDLQDKDTEIINIDLGVLNLNEDLGIEILGGKNDPLYPNNDAIYISFVNKKSLAAKKLRVNDCILKVNDLDCSSVSKQLVLDTMRSLSSVIIVVRRKKPDLPSKSLITSQLQVNNYDDGISLETGLGINEISPESKTSRGRSLSFGDRVLSIINTSMDDLKKVRKSMLPKLKSNNIPYMTAIKSTYCVENGESKPNFNSFKNYSNNMTQTDKSSCTRYYESYKKLQSTGVMLDVPKKPRRNPSSINNSVSKFGEKCAIAKLDSVVDGLRTRLTLTSTKHSKKSKELDENGGTWPKAKSGFKIEHGTGTIIQSHENKERLPLVVLLNDSASCSSQHNSSIDFSVRTDQIDKNELEYYVKNKTNEFDRDTESNAGNSSAVKLSSNTNRTSFTNAQNFISHQHTRYSQSSSSYSGKSMLYGFQPPNNNVSQVSQFHHKYSQSADLPHRTINKINNVGENMSVHHCGDEVGTFPRIKASPRFRIPSYQSVSIKNRTASGILVPKKITDGSVINFEVKIIEPGQIPAEYDRASNAEESGPFPGEIRLICIKEAVESFGIRISSNDSGEVFISSVSKHSVASIVGLKVGHRLLEICGINLRKATDKLAANVLQQCKELTTILVQYNPERLSSAESPISSCPQTPCNSPIFDSNSASIISNVMDLLPHQKSNQNINIRSLRAQEQYYSTMITRSIRKLGISITGKNGNFGIFVADVIFDSVAYKAGLRFGDRILKFNGIDLRKASLEEMIFEVNKSAKRVIILAEYFVGTVKTTKTVNIILSDTQSIPRLECTTTVTTV